MSWHQSLLCHGLSWAMQGSAGLYWPDLGCAGTCWVALGCTGLYVAVLGHTSLYWAVLGHAGLCWAGLAHTGVQEKPHRCVRAVLVYGAHTGVRGPYWCAGGTVLVQWGHTSVQRQLYWCRGDHTGAGGLYSCRGDHTGAGGLYWCGEAILVRGAAAGSHQEQDGRQDAPQGPHLLGGEADDAQRLLHRAVPARVLLLGTGRGVRGWGHPCPPACPHAPHTHAGWGSLPGVAVGAGVPAEVQRAQQRRGGAQQQLGGRGSAPRGGGNPSLVPPQYGWCGSVSPCAVPFIPFAPSPSIPSTSIPSHRSHPSH